MGIAEWERDVQPRMTWPHIADVPGFPWKSFQEVVDRVHSGKLLIGIDPEYAASGAPGIFGTRAGLVNAVILSYPLVFAVALVASAVLLRNYALLIGVPLILGGVFLSTPYLRATVLKWALSGLLVWAVWVGHETTAILTASFLVPSWIGGYANLFNRKKLKAAALKSETLFIVLYQSDALSLKDLDTGTHYSYRIQRLRDRSMEGTTLMDHDVLEQSRFGRETVLRANISIWPSGSSSVTFEPERCEATHKIKLVVCYLANVAWYLRGDELPTLGLFETLIEEVIRNWPERPGSELFDFLPSAQGLMDNPELVGKWAVEGGEQYEINLVASVHGGVYVIEYLPGAEGHGPRGLAVNLAWHYFLLLREIIRELDARSLGILRAAISNLWAQIDDSDHEDESIQALHSLVAAANRSLDRFDPPH